MAGCGVVRELVRRAHEEHRLTADAARALLYTVGLVGRENERIETLFANAGISRKELDRVRNGLQGPMGCKKLKERFPQLCQMANCPPPPPGGYATPALFALHAAPSSRRPSLPWPEIAAGVGCQGSGVGSAGSGGESRTEIEQRLARIEAALERLSRGAEAATEE